ncbi:MAG: proton-conducting transporter membrane subunit [Spirochaetota bacterium]
MVSPIYLIAIPLAVGFFISFFDRIGRAVSLTLFYAGLTALAAISGSWLYSFVQEVAAGAGNVELAAAKTLVFTAGFEPPLSIALAMGLEEAFFLFFANLAGLGAALVLSRRISRGSVTGMVLFLMVMLGAQGLIMTQDLFNLFVFLEISSIATYSLIALQRNSRSMSAGFKYIIAGGIASALFLIGTIYLYRIAGSLAIADIIAAQPAAAGASGVTAVFLLTAALLIELKPFPANGWALDVYQAVQSGVVSVIAVVNSAAVLFALYKVFPMLPSTLIQALLWIGIITFFASNLIGLRQSDVKRMLGYSSSAQIGLLISALSLSNLYGWSPRLQLLVFATVFFGHLFSKAGLFWLTEVQAEANWRRWSGPAKTGGVLLLGVFIAALAGLPPFPTFWAKWVLVKSIIVQQPLFVVLLLIGSLSEAVYLLRWFGRTVHLRRAVVAAGPAAEQASEGADEQAVAGSAAPQAQAPVQSPVQPPAPATWPTPARVAVPAFVAAVLLAAGGVLAGLAADVQVLMFIPLTAALILVLLAWMPSRLLGLVATGLVAATAAVYVPQMEGIAAVFALVFYGGGLLMLIATLYKHQTSPAFYPLFAALVLSLGSLIQAASLLEFFLAWEFMTFSSYFLILLGRNAEKPALNYMTFSVGGAFTLMSGMLLMTAVLPADLFQGSLIAAKISAQPLLAAAPAIIQQGREVFSTAPAGLLGGLAFALIAIGFLTKIGAAGLHIWLPDAYAEAGDDVTPLLSAVLSKAGIFGLMLFVMLFPAALFSWFDLPFVLRWVGVLTAFFGTLMAVFEEDIKRVFAYSSMGQLGYIVLAVGLLNQLGWVTALYLSVLHLLFKGMLFLTSAAVVERTGTRLMYRMGGLIKKMPVSFFSALIAIIALSGVPPLAGFGGKWLLYNALTANNYVLLAAVAFFSSTIAFLYLFRFIYTVFLGQLKIENRQIKEAPFALLLPQIVFIIAIMAVSMYPNLLIKPLQAALPMFSADSSWQGGTIASSIGYWNGSAVMYVTMAVFALMLIWLLIVQRKPQTVSQFNIVFAAERPERPETSHYGHNFFAPYRKALGFLVTPLAGRFWHRIGEITGSVGGAARRLYTGNGQTYALHILLFVTLLYFVIAR